MTHRLLSLLDYEMASRRYAQGQWKADTFYSRLLFWAERQPDAWAARDGARRLTYAQLLAWADALADELATRGVRPGERVAVWQPSRVESVVALLACSRMDYVCVPSLHRDSTTGDVLALLERCSGAALIGERGWGADSARRDIFAELGSVGSIRCGFPRAPLAGIARDPARRDEGIPMARSGGRTYSTNPDRIFYLAFTSGTTGQPKGVMHSDNTLLSNGRAIAGDWQLDTSAVIYTLSPMSHNMGTVSFAIALACGGELVLHGALDQKRALDRIVETGATYLIGVPTHAIDLLTELRRRDATSLGAVRAFQLAGSAIPRQLAESLLALGVVPQNTYGMTENCSFLYTRRDDLTAVIVETCGRCADGMEIALWDPDDPDRLAPPGAVGEIGVRGASQMLGYFDDQPATERSLNNGGWFMTGDLARRVGENFAVVGRKKDLIIRGGHNIHPAKVEDLAMRHAGVLKAAAFPVSDERLGERMCLAVIARADAPPTGDEILAHLHRLELSRYEMPEYFLCVDAFPLTASGKILKRELVRMVASGEMRPARIRWSGP
ncbi:MAG: class I adenylate-forming enzyme family protein [Variibacter sp.]